MSKPLALVTGSAKRLGAAMALRLAREGFRLAIHCNTSISEAREVVALIRDSGGEAQLFAADLAQPEAAADLWARVTESMGPIALLVNNASTFHHDDLLGLDEAAFDNHLAVNLKAPVRLIEAMANQSPTPDGALVVNMLDNKVFAPNPDFFTYSLSKAGLETATKLSAMRLAGRVRVCAIAPSITLISGAQSEAEFQASARINPLHRRVQPEDICDALLYLWQDKRLTGEILAVDAGQALLRLPRDVAFL